MKRSTHRDKNPGADIKKAITLLFIVFAVNIIAYAQTTVVLTTSGSWTVPAGVNSVTVECQGGGGGGGGATGSSGTYGTTGGGGGGGGYSATTVSVTPGNVYNYTIGTGGNAGAGGGTAYGGTGGTTTITGTGLSLNATGGTGGRCTNIDNGNGVAGTGGTGSGGTLIHNGGNGSVGTVSSTSWGGGGGGGAGNGSIGSNGGPGNGTANGGAGGSAGTGTAGGNGGTGWIGSFTGGNGSAGSVPGGGGGGGGSWQSNVSGGAGARGQVILHYTIVLCGPPTSITTSVTPSSSCITPQSVTFDVTGSTGGALNGGTWEYQWQDGATILQAWSAASSYTASLSSSVTYTVYMRTTACNTLISSGFNASYILNTAPIQPSAITGNATPCPNSMQTYSVTNVAGITYTWTFPTGWTQTGGGTSNSVTVTVGPGSGDIQVTPSNSCGLGTASTLAVVPTGTAPTLNVTPASGTVCGGVGIQLTASGDGTSYSWLPAIGLNNANIATPFATPSLGTTYVVTSSNLTGCTSTASVAIIVAPSVVASATATPDTVCSGASVTLSSDNNPLPGNNFSQTISPWTTTNTSTAGNNPANAAWTIHPSTYMFTSTILFITMNYYWNYGTGNNYALSNEMDQAGGCLICTPQTHTKLISPAFSTVGYTGLNLTFKHVLIGGDSTYSVQNNEAFVEVSTNGTTWTTLTSYKGWSTTLQGGQDIDSTKNVTGIFTQTITYRPKYVSINLNAYIGNPSVYVRFRHDTRGTTGAWTVGDIKLNGSPLPTVASYSWSSNPSGFSSTVQSPTATPTQNTIYNVTVTSNTGCTGTASVPVTVLSGPAQPGTITGNALPCEGSSQTYSVPNVTGLTYTWTFPTGWTQTAGGTSNTVTVTAASTSGDISVTANNSCGASIAQTLPVVLNTVPVPGIITGNAAPCGSASETYSVANVSGVNYAWTFPADWTQTGGGTTNSVTVTTGTASGNITVIASNVCGSSAADTLPVVLTIPAAQPSTIAGNDTICQGASQAYSVDNVAGVNYTWTFPIGWTQTSGGTTNSIMVTAGTVNGDIIVIATNACGSSSPQTMTVILNALPSQPSVIVGNATPCIGSTETYSVTNVTGVFYTWSIPTGWTLISGGSTNSISVTVGTTGGNITVAASSVCGYSPDQILPVDAVTMPLKPGPISGNATVCSGTSTTFSVTPLNLVTSYQWVVYPSAAGTPSATTATTTINWSAGWSGTAHLKVRAINGCGIGPYSDSIAILVHLSPVAPVITQNMAVLTSSYASGNHWYLNGSPITSAINQNYTVTQNGYYFVVYTDSYGCQSISDTIHFVTYSIDEISSTDNLKVYPNPSRGEVNITWDGTNENDVDIAVYSTFGVLVYSNQHLQLNDQKTANISLDNASGLYMVVIKTKTAFICKELVIEK